MKKKISVILLLLIILYLSIGVWFHIQENRYWNLCREERLKRGEFVEPEVYPVIGVLFDVSYWPVYMLANKYNFGSIFGRKCNVIPDTIGD